MPHDPGTGADMASVDYDVLDPSVPEDLVDAPERYELTDLDGAAWALRTIGRARTALAQLRAQRDAQLALVTSWYNDRANGPERAASAAENLVRAFALLARQRDVKTIDTPWGSVATRARRDMVAFDPDVALDLIVEGPVTIRTAADDYVELPALSVIEQLRAELPHLRIKVDVDAVAFRKACAAGPDGTVVYMPTGEVVPGATIVVQEPSVTVTPSDSPAAWLGANPPVGLRPRIPARPTVELVLPQLVDDPELQGRLDTLVRDFINERDGEVTQADVDAFIAELDRGNEQHRPADACRIESARRELTSAEVIRHAPEDIDPDAG